jgi:hypothetical protein
MAETVGHPSHPGGFVKLKDRSTSNDGSTVYHQDYTSKEFLAISVAPSLLGISAMS